MVSRRDHHLRRSIHDLPELDDLFLVSRLNIEKVSETRCGPALLQKDSIAVWQGYGSMTYPAGNEQDLRG